MTDDPVRDLARFAESGCLEVRGEVKETVRVEVDGVGFRIVSMSYDRGRDITSLELEAELPPEIPARVAHRPCPWLDART